MELIQHTRHAGRGFRHNVFLSDLFAAEVRGKRDKPLARRRPRRTLCSCVSETVVVRVGRAGTGTRSVLGRALDLEAAVLSRWLC